MRSSILVFVLMLFCAFDAIGESSAASLLQAYQTGLRPFPKYTVDCRSVAMQERPRADAAQRRAGGTTRGQYVRDGDRLDVTSTQVERVDATGKSIAAAQIGTASRGIIDGWYVAFDVPRKGVPHVGLYSSEGARHVGNVLARLGGCEALEGYAAGDMMSIAQIMHDARDLTISGAELVEGNTCKRLVAKTDHGVYTVCLDDQTLGVARKVTVEKAGDNYYSGKRLPEWKGFIPYGSQKPTTMVKVTWTMDSVKLREVKGVQVPTECKLHYVSLFADGNSSETWVTCTRDAIDPSPDFRTLKAFAPDLPEGMTLANQEDSQFPFEWRQGKPTPKNDKATIKHIDATVDKLRKDQR